ncbi:hypothetical protein RM572_01625 [Streptomyces sp. DSM 42041]|uniref:Metalloprotease n=1 Tax=Streptomyces hazeniae TaxID=3075538 RepID=A0ABU2NKF4_9ACTN|nr:protealysin inhibitor emfourin [Streptomyces sp. DSM 42041]MDT0377475.1 hypothetical protein [Streptomyces sp. DSM 42041]
MRITVIRTGGFGGVTRRAMLDTGDLPDSGEVAALADQAVAEGHRDERPVGVPDGFHYEIEADGATAYCADPRLTDAQRTLITRVLKEGA